MTRRSWRDRWPATPRQGDAVTRHLEDERLERVYASVAAYQRDAAMLAKDGWQVTAVDHRRLHGGRARLIARRYRRTRRDCGLQSGPHREDGDPPAPSLDSSWIRLQLQGDRPHIWPLPPGHYLERTEGRYGCPRPMVATGHR
jgi:hypothetical protein